MKHFFKQILGFKKGKIIVHFEPKTLKLIAIVCKC